jgi:hypothetical protein
MARRRGCGPPPDHRRLKDDRLKKPKPAIRLCRHANEAIYYRDQDLASEILGYPSFTDALFAYPRHLAEEHGRPAAAYIWDLVDHAIPFEGEMAR